MEEFTAKDAYDLTYPKDPNEIQSVIELIKQAAEKGKDYTRTNIILQRSTIDELRRRGFTVDPTWSIDAEYTIRWHSIK